MQHVHCGQPPSVFYLSSLLFNSSTSWLRSDKGIWQPTINDSRHVAKILKKQKTSFSTIPLLRASFCQIPIFRIKSFQSVSNNQVFRPPKKSEKPWRFLKTKELLEYVLQSIPAIHVATVHSRHFWRLKPRWFRKISEWEICRGLLNKVE